MKGTQINSCCPSLFCSLFILFVRCTLAIMYIPPWQRETIGGAHGRTFLHKSVNTYTADRQNTWRTRGPSQVAPTHTTNNTHPLTTLHWLACWHSRVITFFFFFRRGIESARKLMMVISHVGPQFMSRSTWHTTSASGKSPNKVEVVTHSVSQTSRGLETQSVSPFIPVWPVTP